MATGQSMLDRMEVLFPELQLQPGESDVTKGLLALNMAQDYFEALAAAVPGFLGGNTVGTVATTANQESTAFPVGLLRIDKLQYIDPTTNRPAWDLVPIYDAGGHAPSNYFPYNITSATASGRPIGYWTNGMNIYWDPLPSGTHTVRTMGFLRAADITALGTFAYDDVVMLPLAIFATKLLRVGIDDPIDGLQALAEEVFSPVITTLAGFQQERPKGLVYLHRHDT